MILVGITNNFLFVINYNLVWKNLGNYVLTIQRQITLVNINVWPRAHNSTKKILYIKLTDTISTFL